MPEFHIFPDAAAVSATAYDWLWWYEVSIVLIMTLVIFAGVFFFAIKYRRRSESYIPPAIEGSRLLEITWSIIPFLVMLRLLLGRRALLPQSEPPTRRHERLRGGQTVDVEGAVSERRA